MPTKQAQQRERMETKRILKETARCRFYVIFFLLNPSNAENEKLLLAARLDTFYLTAMTF